MTSTISDIAAQAGAKLQPPLGEKDVVSFRLRDDGGLTVTTANGQSIEACCPAELEGEWRNTAEEVIATLGRIVPGGSMKTGITYRKKQTIFLEASR